MSARLTFLRMKGAMCKLDCGRNNVIARRTGDGVPWTISRQFPPVAFCARFNASKNPSTQAPRCHVTRTEGSARSTPKRSASRTADPPGRQKSMVGSPPSKRCSTWCRQKSVIPCSRIQIRPQANLLGIPHTVPMMLRSLGDNRTFSLGLQLLAPRSPPTIMPDSR